MGIYNHLSKTTGKDVRIVAATDAQWGDTGKGKVADLVAEEADVNARGTGADNSGHTTVAKIRGVLVERIYHLIPAGIRFDNDKITIMGNGMAIRPESLCLELDDLETFGMTYNNLHVSKDAHVIMPFQVNKDKAKNQSQKSGGIGSTGRGVGPAYTDKVARYGITIEDLVGDVDKLKAKIAKSLENYPDNKLSIGEILDVHLLPYVGKIKPLVRDTVSEMHDFARRGLRIGLEGAQGALLSIEHGSYPYVTSSDCTLNGTAGGVGLCAADVDVNLLIAKYPFKTRVGGGPFPSELGGAVSELYCQDEKTKEIELKEHGIPFTKDNKGKIKYDLRHPKILDLMRSSDEFTQGVGLRLAANEYGASTGRPRRTGWTDAVSSRYARAINGRTSMWVLTKVDCASDLEFFKICEAYDIDGTRTTTFSKSNDFLRAAKPIYRTYGGYSDVSGLTKDHNFDDLPTTLKESIADFERMTFGNVIMVTNGPGTDQYILK